MQPNNPFDGSIGLKSLQVNTSIVSTELDPTEVSVRFTGVVNRSLNLGCQYT